MNNLDNCAVMKQMGGLAKSPLAGLAALGLGGLGPANAAGLNPAGKKFFNLLCIYTIEIRYNLSKYIQ